MGKPQVFTGEAGAYTAEEPAPFAYGRTSVCLRGRDGAGKAVCIKSFHRLPKTPTGELALDEFAREVHARQRMSHPHILPILDFGMSGPSSRSPFLVLPLCRGDLSTLLETRSYVPLHEVLPLLQQVATAIDFAHGQGVIHGDVKPENILFAETGSHVYLSDFGVSRFFSFDEPITTLQGGAEAGSTGYLAPEQVSDGKQSTQSDIYSFAVVAYELLTGSFPFDRSQPPFRQMQAKVTGQVIDPIAANPILPASVGNALLRGLQLDRTKRPATATEFCNQLASPAVSAPAAAVAAETGAKGETVGSGRVGRWWDSLDTGGRVAVITVLITAVFGLLGTIVGIVPGVLSALTHSPPTAEGAAGKSPAGAEAKSPGAHPGRSE
jgi:serine/threonine protein kinase